MVSKGWQFLNVNCAKKYLNMSAKYDVSYVSCSELKAKCWAKYETLEKTCFLQCPSFHA